MSAIPKFPGLGSMPPSAPSHSPLDLEDGERIVHINLMGDGADTASMLFIVNDKNGEVFQVTCDKEGVITGRAQVGGGNQDWPKMLNSSGELVPFQSYFIGEDGNLYGNVLEAGADPTTIEDPDLSTWVNLGPAENASNKYEESNLPKEVPFVLLSDGTGVAIPQDYALPVENELAQDFGAQVDPNNGNIPFDLGSVSLENTDGVPSEYTLPVNTNGQPFEKYCFVDIGDDDIRLYVIDRNDKDEAVLYDLGTIPPNNFGNEISFTAGDVLSSPQHIDSLPPTLNDNLKFDVSLIDVDTNFEKLLDYVIMDSARTSISTGSGRDAAFITELGVNANGEPIEYHVDMGKGREDKAYLYGAESDWVATNVEGNDTVRLYTHVSTGTLVYMHHSVENIRFFTTAEHLDDIYVKD